MLIKWMCCEVADRARFDRGQRSWESLAGQPGLLAQFGGWSRRERTVAHLFGLWSGSAAYDGFMAERHDDFASDQAGAYTAIRVRLFTRLLDIAQPDLTSGALLRLAHCQVHADRTRHFEQAQRSVWNPGMATAPGMLGGVFAAGEPGEYLVLSAWRSPADHASYLTDQFPALRRDSDAERDLANIAGDLIEFHDAWTVHGTNL
jgi:heme-degrading monooxygenase HmoA